MFTGIIEELGKVVKITEEGRNIRFEIEAEMTDELKIDQSVSHNGVCLTVVDIDQNRYAVTAIKETLSRSNLGDLNEGDEVNLERCMQMNDRLDGHIVQGHVDKTATVDKIDLHGGSHEFFFSYDPDEQHITVEKGSITVNGVSLTVVHSSESRFSVAVIPYTYEHTNFRALKPGNRVNLEFDIIGKYVAAYLNKRSS